MTCLTVCLFIYSSDIPSETVCFILGLDFLQSSANFLSAHLIQVLGALLLRDLGMIKHNHVDGTSGDTMLSPHVSSSTEWGSVTGSSWDKSMSIPPVQVLHISIQILETLNKMAIVDVRYVQDIPQDLKVMYNLRIL